jgi:predicted CDP-diglyceride synthetase/phosphatidate cytidylyltransferase
MKSFWITLAACIILSIAVAVIVLVMGKEDFLFESSPVWYAISSLSFVISVISFIIGLRLIQKDPRFKSIKLEVKFAMPRKHAPAQGT